MNRRLERILLAGGVAAFAGAFFWLLTTRGPLAPVGVQTARVLRGELRPSVFGIGTVEARLAYAVGPVAPGRMLRVLVDQGDEVKAGQLLAEMDPIDLDRRIQAARSVGSRALQAVHAAEAQVADAESRDRLAKANRDRDLTLHQQQVVTRQALDNTLHEAERAAASLALARANLAAARQDAARAGAEAQAAASLRQSLRLLSPVDGIVVSREAEPGTTVVAGQAALRIVAPQTLWVRARVDQSRARDLAVGQPALIALRSNSAERVRGRVARIELQSDPVTEERVVDVAFEAPPPRLYLGELAEVTIELPGEPGVLIAPSAAITREGGRVGVWQDVGGRVRFRPATVGGEGQTGVTRIVDGLAEGDPIIVYSSAQLRDGLRVRERDVARP
jgi:HlyD family secretion protein